MVSTREQVRLKDLEAELHGFESHPCHLQAVLLETVNETAVPPHPNPYFQGPVARI